MALGALVVAVPSGLEANHLPFELNRTEGQYGTLRCHVARANAAWHHNGAECLVIFQGPSAYISPNLYVSKKEHGKVVPTYNYVVVHAHGRLLVHDDEKWLRALLGRLTRRFEAGQATPWKMGDAPQAFIDERVKEIVGLEIQISRLEGKWKMSRNRPEADRASMVAGLSSSSKPEEKQVAEIVEGRPFAPPKRL
jgi:transcriptional regulator